MTIKREIIITGVLWHQFVSVDDINLWDYCFFDVSVVVHIQASLHYFLFTLPLKPQKRVFIYFKIVNLFMNNEWLLDSVCADTSKTCSRVDAE